WCHARKRPPLRVSTTTTNDRPYMHLGRQPLPQQATYPQVVTLARKQFAHPPVLSYPGSSKNV
ncbi:hypothetical protein BHE74_00054173, partial [Ensete ventricosum]